jgi:hypothetical protein
MAVGVGQSHGRFGFRNSSRSTASSNLTLSASSARAIVKSVGAIGIRNARTTASTSSRGRSLPREVASGQADRGSGGRELFTAGEERRGR